MSATKSKRSFFIVVRDHDRKLFSIHGPVSDDAMIKTLVAEAQQTGRVIDCLNGGSSSIENVTKKVVRDSGYSEVGNALSAG